MCVNIVVATALLLVYVAPYFDPHTAWIFTLFGLAYPYILIVNLLFIALWLFFWNRYTWLSIVVVLLGIVQLDRFYGLSGSGILPSTNDISILSFNTQGLAGIDTDGADFDRLIQHVSTADIVLLQEVSGSALNKIATRLPNHEVFQSPDVHLAVLSKFKMGDSGLVNKENVSNGSVWVDILIKDFELRVYNAHLQSYRVTKTAEDIIDSGDLGDEKTWDNVRSVLGRIKDMSKRRSVQVEQISKHINASNKDILLGGDFNDTPVSNTYRKLAGKLTDTFCAAGQGVGTTYAGKIPLLRIDYIFADADFEVISHKVIESPISDHYPIKSVIRLKPD